jgi:hypothetical protein
MIGPFGFLNFPFFNLHYGKHRFALTSLYKFHTGLFCTHGEHLSRVSLAPFALLLLDLSFRADAIAATPIKELPGRVFILLGQMEITRNDRFTGRRPMPRLKRATSEVATQGAPLLSPSHLFAIYRRRFEQNMGNAKN